MRKKWEMRPSRHLRGQHDEIQRCDRKMFDDNSLQSAFRCAQGHDNAKAGASRIKIATEIFGTENGRLRWSRHHREAGIPGLGLASSWLRPSPDYSSRRWIKREVHDTSLKRKRR